MAVSKITKKPTALDVLRGYSTNLLLDEMRANLDNDNFVIIHMALMGQITLFYSQPGNGKTLFFLAFLIRSIEAGLIHADDVIYINADDNYTGTYTKTDIAESCGFTMVSPGVAGISTDMVIALLVGMAKEGTAKGKVVVLDTLKKFASMMSKDDQKKLYEQLRMFTSKGGTVLLAGHANKHKSKEGEIVYEGTSDTMNDIDCAYSMYRLTDKDDEDQLIEFRCEKDRGDVIPKITYKYTKRSDFSYKDMLRSVEHVGEDEALEASKISLHKSVKKKYSKEIAWVTELLKQNGPMTQKEIIVSRSKGATEITERNLGAALRNGLLDGDAWTKHKGEHNSWIYSLDLCSE